MYPTLLLKRLFALCYLEGNSPRKPFECDSAAAADIMLLVDGSWSIGRTNFRRVRDFLEGLMTPFHIGPNNIQIGEEKDQIFINTLLQGFFSLSCLN